MKKDIISDLELVERQKEWHLKTGTELHISDEEDLLERMYFNRLRFIAGNTQFSPSYGKDGCNQGRTTGIG